MTNMKLVEAKAVEMAYSVENIKSALNRLRSRKSRLTKQKGRADYQAAMTAILTEEKLLVDAKKFIEGDKKHTTTFEQADVDMLTYDETMKAIASIQSKKANTRWLTTEDGDNDEYRNAVRIEKMLLEHKQTVKPIDDNTIRKSEVQRVIDTIKTAEYDITIESVIKMLERLI